MKDSKTSKFSKKAENSLPSSPKAPLLATDAEPPTREGAGDISTYLIPNTSKVNQMQPALLGMVKLGDLAADLSAWWQETLNGQRDYYSLIIRDSVKAKEAWQKKEKIEPLSRLKLYQFRQQSLDDPDYVSSMSFVHEGRGYWALLWVDIPSDFPGAEDVTEEDLKKIKYQLIFSQRRPSEKWESGLTNTMLSAQEHLLERRRVLEDRKLLQARRAEREEDFETDELP